MNRHTSLKYILSEIKSSDNKLKIHKLYERPIFINYTAKFIKTGCNLQYMLSKERFLKLKRIIAPLIKNLGIDIIGDEIYFRDREYTYIPNHYLENMPSIAIASFYEEKEIKDIILNYKDCIFLIYEHFQIENKYLYEIHLGSVSKAEVLFVLNNSKIESF